LPLRLIGLPHGDIKTGDTLMDIAGLYEAGVADMREAAASPLLSYHGPEPATGSETEMSFASLQKVHAVFTSIFFWAFCASALFGKVTVRTPLEKSAAILSWSTPSGRLKDR